MGAPWQGPRSPCQSVVGQTLGTNYKLCPALIEFPSILHPTRAKIQGFPVLVHFSQVAIMTNRETKQRRGRPFIANGLGLENGLSARHRAALEFKEGPGPKFNAD